MKCLSLFAGIGGFDIAVERVGGTTIAFVEVDPFCQAVLRKHWPDVPIYDDVRSFDPEPFRGRVDLVTGGFPCQDVSAAGKGAGIGGARSGLWREMARIIAGIRPRRCLIENVPALRTRGADRVLADLEALGYDAWPLVVGAWAVGAPHRRDRVWIVAQRHEGRALDDAMRGRSGDEDEAIQAGRFGALDAGSVADADDKRREEQRGAEPVHEGPGRAKPERDRRWPARPGEEQHEWEEPRLVAYAAKLHSDASDRQPRRDLPESRDDRGSQGAATRPTQQPLGRAVDGVSSRLVRARRRNNREALKAYGNSICWPVAEAVLRAMLDIEVA